MIPDALHLVFAGGTTGGHLFPGLAVAEHFAQRMPQMRITFAGRGKPFEQRHVAADGFDYHALPCQPIPRRPRDVFSFLRANLAGYLAARGFLRRNHVDCVIGLGSYASVPMARAATHGGVPLILLEQNAVAGRATRWLARSANMICLAMPHARAGLTCRCNVQVTGNPLRLSKSKPVLHSLPRRHRLLILGGSGGAQAINESAPRALANIRLKLNGWRILHQSGESGFETTCRLYRQLNFNAEVVPFIVDLPDVLTETDLAVSRAGGTTLSELAAAGVPAVLLPYPHATDDHQRRNADVFTAAGGSIMVDQREVSARLHDDLATALSRLLHDCRRRSRMSDAMLGLARPQAATDVAALILEAVGRPCPAGKIPAAA